MSLTEYDISVQKEVGKRCSANDQGFFHLTARRSLAARISFLQRKKEEWGKVKMYKNMAYII